MNIHPSITWTDPARQAAFADWLQRVASVHRLERDSLRPASADASQRRYFRVDAMPGSEAASRIVMDIPPSPEEAQRFVALADFFRHAGLRTPRVLECDAAKGFLLIEDLGTTTLLDVAQSLDPARAAGLYRAATTSLIALQALGPAPLVPPYDRAFMRRELDLFSQWYVERQCAAQLSDEERQQLARCEALILDTCTAQPSVLMHRDYHSRNLMVSEPIDAAPGVLDFQDAVWGPVTYDLVSLLRDAYIEWDEEVQIDWAVRYWERARKAGLPVSRDFGEFWRDFEWMGLQRHLKILGIFSRLHHRDGKDGYLQDIPRVWRYAHHVAARYQGLGPLAHLLERLAGTQRESGYTF